MTLGELKEAVALLGFESTLQDLDDTAEKHFLFCANRALWTVGKLRPRTAVYDLAHFPPKSLLSASEYRHKGGVDLEISVSGAKAYTFYVSGSGSLTLRDGEEKTVFSWTQPRLYRGLLSGGSTTLVFGGPYSYSVRGLALYEDTVSARIADIPDGAAFVSYDISALTEDFALLEDPPLCAPTELWRVEDRRVLRLRRDAQGVYEVRYVRKPLSISEDTPENRELGLDEDLCQLVPLLCATFLCLEENPDKSSYYYSLYKEQYRLIQSTERSHKKALWASSNGW